MVANCRWFTPGHQHPQQSQPHHPYPSPGKGRALTVLWKFMLSTSALLRHYLSSLKQRGRLFHTVYVSRNGAFNRSLSEYFIQYQTLIFLQMIVKFLHHCRSKNAKYNLSLQCSVFSCLPPNMLPVCDPQLQVSEESFSVTADLNSLLICLCAKWMDLMNLAR